MKRLMMLCAVMLAMLVSCTKDYKNKIVGTWKCEQETTKKTKDGETTESIRTKRDGNEIRTMIFREDMTCTDYMMTGMNNVEGTAITMEHLWRYFFDDVFLLLTDDYQDVKYRITSLNSSQFVFVYETTAVTRAESPEALDYDEMEIVYTMKKQ